MKTIPLKTVTLMNGEQEIKLSYLVQLIEILRHPPEGQALDLDNLRRSVRVLNQLEIAGGAEFVDIEDADFEYMKQRVTNARWPIADQVVLDFVEDVTNPKE